jgi:hypothetical protein
MKDRAKEGDRLTLVSPSPFDIAVGMRPGLEAEVLEGGDTIIKVRFKEWRNPAAPLFDKGERVMLLKCFN